MLTSKQVSKKVPACFLAKVSVEYLLACLLVVACLLVGLQSLKLACYLLVCLYDMIFFLAIHVGGEVLNNSNYFGKDM